MKFIKEAEYLRVQIRKPVFTVVINKYHRCSEATEPGKCFETEQMIAF
jgi:hypothetical protein